MTCRKVVDFPTAQPPQPPRQIDGKPPRVFFFYFFFLYLFFVLATTINWTTTTTRTTATTTTNGDVRYGKEGRWGLRINEGSGHETSRVPGMFYFDYFFTILMSIKGSSIPTTGNGDEAKV